jgi:hypothetical protein
MMVSGDAEVGSMGEARTIAATSNDAQLATTVIHICSHQAWFTHVQRIVGTIRRLRHQDDILESATAVLERLARDTGKLRREVFLVVHES